MSALRQKQTCAVQTGMSALPPKADMCSALADVRFVPMADIGLQKERPPRAAVSPKYNQVFRSGCDSGVALPHPAAHEQTRPGKAGSEQR